MEQDSTKTTDNDLAFAIYAQLMPAIWQHHRFISIDDMDSEMRHAARFARDAVKNFESVGAGYKRKKAI